MKSYLHTKITDNVEEAPGYWRLSFKGKKPIEGQPGQFVMIRGNWGRDPVLPRAFSLLEAGDTGQVLVKEVGVGTSLLCKMKKGDDLYVTGPLGNNFTAPANGQHALLVAGGVGVAPLFFLGKALAQSGVKVVFIYGARTRNELSLIKEIETFSELKISTQDGTAGHKGLVTEPLKKQISQENNAVVYSCGPELMLEAVANLCFNSKVQCQVALESPMACGLGTCKGCAVVNADGSFSYVCTDGPVFDARKIFKEDKK